MFRSGLASRGAVRALVVAGLSVLLSGCIVYPAYGPYGHRHHYRPYYDRYE